MKIYENWDPSSQPEYIWWCEQKFLIFLHLLHYNGTNKLDSFVLNLIIHDLKSAFSKHHSQLIHLPLGSPWYKRVARDLNNQNLRAKNSIIKFKKGKMQKKTQKKLTILHLAECSNQNLSPNASDPSVPVAASTC